MSGRAKNIKRNLDRKTRRQANRSAATAHIDKYARKASRSNREDTRDA